MCSVQDEGELIKPEKRPEISKAPRSCMKCEKSACVIIRMNDAMCSDCFVSYTTHKFRSAFGKSKVVRDNETVLVAYSGGQCSCAMVHLIQGGLSKRAQKKLRFTPKLVYIDEGALVNQSNGDRGATTQKIVELMKSSNLPFAVHSIEQALQINNQSDSSEASSIGSHDRIDPILTNEDTDLSNLLEKLRIGDTASDDLQKLLTNAKTLSAKQNIIEVLRQRLLVAIAKQENISKILLGDAATRLSIRLLSNISQGQGAHLPYELSFADKRHKDVMFIRPMREFTAKEVSMYNKLNNVEMHFIPNLSTKASSYASIELLTEEFVTGLQAEYPNTISTIFRTGEKFALGDVSVDSEETCVLCQCPLDTCVGASSALSATQFSQSLCESMATKHSNQDNNSITTGGEGCCQGNQTTSCCGDGDGSCQKPKGMSRDELNSCLCYGCQVITRDMESLELLPSFVKSQASLRSRRREMKAEISEFLIE